MRVFGRALALEKQIASQRDLYERGLKKFQEFFDNLHGNYNTPYWEGEMRRAGLYDGSLARSFTYLLLYINLTPSYLGDLLNNDIEKLISELLEFLPVYNSCQQSIDERPSIEQLVDFSLFASPAVAATSATPSTAATAASTAVDVSALSPAAAAAAAAASSAPASSAAADSTSSLPTAAAAAALEPMQPIYSSFLLLSTDQPPPPDADEAPRSPASPGSPRK